MAPNDFPASGGRGRGLAAGASGVGSSRERHCALLSAAVVGPDLEVSSKAITETRSTGSRPRDDAPLLEQMAAATGIDAGDIEAAIESLFAADRAASVSLEGPGGRTYLMRAFPWSCTTGDSGDRLLTLYDQTSWREASADANVLNELVHRLPHPFIAVDEAGLIREWSPGAEAAYGYEAEEVVGRTSFLDLVDPEDRGRVTAHLRAIEGDPRTEPLESRRVRKDGSSFDVLCEGVVIPNDRTRHRCFMEMDVTERRDRERRREFFVREMDHQVKNTLAAVQSIVDGSIRSSEGSFSAFEKALRTRLGAYARVHRALWASNWQGLEVRDLVDRVLSPYGSDQLSTEGNEFVVVSGSAVLPLAMTLHELASNATTHGALSVPDGHVLLTWDVDPETGRLDVTWTESGGPPVDEPKRRGFGLVIVERALPFQTGADVTLGFPPQGVTCHMRIPLENDNTVGGDNQG